MTVTVPENSAGLLSDDVGFFGNFEFASRTPLTNFASGLYLAAHCGLACSRSNSTYQQGKKLGYLLYTSPSKFSQNVTTRIQQNLSRVFENALSG